MKPLPPLLSDFIVPKPVISRDRDIWRRIGERQRAGLVSVRPISKDAATVELTQKGRERGLADVEWSRVESNSLRVIDGALLTRVMAAIGQSPRSSLETRYECPIMNISARKHTVVKPP
jgi:hypothetical protein